MSFDAASLTALGPLWIVIAMGCVVLLAETFAHGEERRGLGALSLAACLAALVAVGVGWADAGTGPSSPFQGMLVVDRTALFLDGTFLAAAALTILFSGPFLREHGFEFGEFFALVLFTTAGMMIVAHASHLVSLLLGIETMSLGAYVLTGCWRRSLRSSEAAMKYFLGGAFATGFLVYGMALCYGLSGGEMSYAGLAGKAAEAARNPLFGFGIDLIVIAFGFKVAAVPFHMWAPDAYEGAPTPVSGFMAAAVKAAAFGGMVRLFATAFGAPVLAGEAHGWPWVVAGLSAATMTLGNLGALRQENVKRLLAYSSVAHAGYLLAGVAAMGLGSAGARPAILFYLLAYTFTTLGTFGVVAWAGNRSDERLFIDDWAGLGGRRAGVALGMTVFLLSLGGVPPTGGFFGKFYLFRSAVEHPQLIWLVVLGVLNSVVSVYYYLRIVVVMWFKEPVRSLRPTDAAGMRIGILTTALAVVLMGLLPGLFVEAAGEGAPVAAVTVPAIPPPRPPAPAPPAQPETP